MISALRKAFELARTPKHRIAIPIANEKSSEMDVRLGICFLLGQLIATKLISTIMFDQCLGEVRNASDEEVFKICRYELKPGERRILPHPSRIMTVENRKIGVGLYRELIHESGGWKTSDIELPGNVVRTTLEDVEITRLGLGVLVGLYFQRKILKPKAVETLIDMLGQATAQEILSIVR